MGAGGLDHRGNVAARRRRCLGGENLRDAAASAGDESGGAAANRRRARPDMPGDGGCLAATALPYRRQGALHGAGHRLGKSGWAATHPAAGGNDR